MSWRILYADASLSAIRLRSPGQPSISVDRWYGNGDWPYWVSWMEGLLHFCKAGGLLQGSGIFVAAD